MKSNIDRSILYLRRKDVELACQSIDSLAIMREVFSMHGLGQTVLPDEAYLSWVNGQGERVRSLNMPGYIGGSLQVSGTKIINSNIVNPAHGLPRASGLTLLYDDASARVMCIMEGAYISSLRTASVTALAIELLKGREIENAAFIGAGVLARAHIDFLAKRLSSLRQIYLFDTDRQRIASLQRDLARILQEHDITLFIGATAEKTIRPAQLIVAATTVNEGYIHFEWLQRGSILINVSLDDPLPEVVFNADLVVVDDWNLVKSDQHRLIGRMYREKQVLGPDEEGVEQPGICRRIDVGLADLVLGTKTGREKPDEIILVNPFGLAIEDLAIAAHVYRSARKLGIGEWLES